MTIPDWTGRMQDLYPASADSDAIPMYSYSRPAWTLWQAIIGELFQAGWTEREVQAYLQSRYPRWELDGELGERLRALGEAYGRELVRDQELRRNCRRWSQEGIKPVEGGAT